MAGHSHWAQIKRKKAAVDAKRGKIFTKLIREIMVAARLGGGDPSGNPRLRAAIQAARAVNMPKENIERAIKKGTGEIAGEAYEEVTYEGYGPGGVAVLIESMTDNKRRTVSELRHIFSKCGGNLAEPGAVAWVFERKGLIVVSREAIGEEELLDLALEAGAEDVREQESEYEVITTPEAFEEVKKALEERVSLISAQVTMVPKTTVRLEDEKSVQQMMRLMDMLEEHDDVQKVYANFDIPDQLMEKVA
ncbi:YebC/PmpR family DNA-binding transcriptional regulator [Thermosulfuriphilus ammonigenes]|uniref:Probable transcriptional regulatory protein G4V39_00380 n=1 Tax=Thermosulfuriphilus ammonigenes TaxID=1936021 RepID=A0A6G7PT11_9BACT|nr:YebC/PmpR family DNA-binding transcriptional regulator [Thermosulfuriphilus ammonigenes]MBA2849199.1 YebC/PmpR family DNA-binding regulatory protein [Thermosulfuriphilus ammonigenes]QIJ70814.1 YebC/PmpR family DNA-binding transcriptional regulator [Thermosulfuriphilus ammonigenes]HFB83351.1 YebC/PmpR family DNA-binding transcriptional regulator [Thermodesulfatator sp.]